jgi:cytochrome P450
MAVVIAHPSSVEHVLVTHREAYVKGRTYDGMRLLTGQGLLTLEGSAWRQRRKLAQPAFHKESIRALTGQMITVFRRMLERWRRDFPRGGVVDVHREMMNVTLEVVGETLFGQRLDGVADTSSHAFSEALESISERGNAPLQLPLAVPTPGNLRFRKSLKTLDAMVYETLAKVRALPEEKRGQTLLGMLMSSRDAETGEALSDAELRNEAITLFLAGHETTALLLTWGFTLLDANPEVVERIRQELAEVVGEREPTPEDLPKLSYLRQTIDEILRLRTPTWAVARDIVAPDLLDGFQVRPGELVLPVAYLTHRHPAFWPEPDRFLPERFSPAQSEKRAKWSYYPFSAGPRMCIGNIFSLVEAQAALALMLQAADIRLVPNQDLRPIATVTMRPSAPVQVALSWRG